MNPTVYKKLKTRRTSMMRKHQTRLSEAPRSADKMFMPRFCYDEYQDDLKKIRANPSDRKQIGLFVVGGVMSDDVIPETHQAVAFKQKDTEKLQLHFSYQTSRDLITRHLSTSLGPGRGMGFNRHIQFIMGLYSLGWHAEADAAIREIWSHQSVGVMFGMQPTDTYKWFMTYFALESREMIEDKFFEAGDGEPDMPDTPHSFLLGCWNDPDPERVSNALLAYSESNMAHSLLPPNKRYATGFPIDSWWFVPWDILAINMRRKSRGLDWVESADPRWHEVWQNRDEMPFVKDDLAWPAYLELCEIMNITPYEPRSSITVKVDPETFDLERVG